MLKPEFFVLLLILSMAFAQQSPSAPPPVAAHGQPGAPLNPEDDCTRFYPPSAAQAGEDGITVLSVEVATDGTIKEPRVSHSSGHADLDNAALACVSGAHVAPLTSKGAPINASAQMPVIWRRSNFEVPPGRLADGCQRLSYPPLAVRLNHQGETVVSYTIATDGSVKNLTVTKSSGYPELDQASVTCVSRSRFWPVMQDGHGIEVDGKTEFAWHLSH